MSAPAALTMNESRCQCRLCKYGVLMVLSFHAGLRAGNRAATGARRAL